MCLYNAKKIEQKGEIKCYKVFTKDGSSLFQPGHKRGDKWVVGETRTAEFDEGETEETMLHEDGTIHSGAFHSFQNQMSVVTFATDFFRNYEEEELSVAECVIPEDSKYVYEGNTYGWSQGCVSLPCYASEKLKVTKIYPLVQRYGYVRRQYSR